MEARRRKIAVLLRAGHGPTEIATLMKCSRTTVYNVRKRLNNDLEDNGLSQKPGAGRPHKIDRKRVIRTFWNNPLKTMTSVAEKFHVNQSTISRVVKAANGKSLVRQKKPMLTKKMQQNRFNRAKILLNNLKSAEKGRVIFFSDEKTFTVDPVFNRRNDRYIRIGKSAVQSCRYVSTTKHPASVMMLGIIGSNGKVMPPIWFETGYRLNANTYAKVMEATVIPWMKEGAGSASFAFQQDGAPAHTAKVVQNLLKEKLGEDGFWSKLFWPPSSPDLNPLDYSIWARVEKNACAVRHPNVAALKLAVNKEWAAMPESYVKDVCAGFRRRLNHVIDANGSIIE